MKEMANYDKLEGLSLYEYEMSLLFCKFDTNFFSGEVNQDLREIVDEA